MRKSRAFLVLSGLAFFGWLGWLAYLALWVKPNPVVVSRSQALAATHFVVAQVTLDPQTGWPDPDVKVVEDLRPKAAALTGTIRVRNLKEARMPGQKFPPEWKADEPYLLVLTHLAGTDYELTGQPPAPGEVPERRAAAKPWVYPWTAEVRRQFERVVPKG